MRNRTWIMVICFLSSMGLNNQALSLADQVQPLAQSLDESDPASKFEFEGEIKSVGGISDEGVIEGKVTFIKGLKGQALYNQPNNGFNNKGLNKLLTDGTKDFSIQYWIKTTSTNPTVLISHKDFTNKGVTAQKNAG